MVTKREAGKPRHQNTSASQTHPCRIGLQLDMAQRYNLRMKQRITMTLMYGIEASTVVKYRPGGAAIGHVSRL